MSATYASKNFGKVRKKAKESPQFISENNVVDTVILDYKEYEEMYAEIQALRELTWEVSIANRLEHADKTKIRYSLQEVMSEDEYNNFRKIDPDSISDEELFGWIMSKNFEVVFIEEAVKDYEKLDGSIKKLVNVAIAKMRELADELGEELTNKHGMNLIGCRKIKFNRAGIRMVYRIVGDKAEIAEIIVVGRREDNEVYEIAYKRLQTL